MACITKLTKGFAYDCDTGATGLLSAMIINKADIASFSLGGSPPDSVSALTLNAGAKAYKIDTPKRTLTISEALKVNEGAPNAFTHSATLVSTQSSSSALLNIVSSMTNGSFVIAALGVDGTARIYGLYYGMFSTNIDRSSHDNGGWYSITLGTPEQFIGEDALIVTKALYTTLYNAAVYL